MELIKRHYHNQQPGVQDLYDGMKGKYVAHLAVLHINKSIK